ncbi:MAG TPA: hypothetical protein DIT32_04030 [Peptococcaceae bacterium]|nr:hypothetical protein [Peptococcaceae bacterium]
MKKWKKAIALVTMLVTISALSAVAYAATDNSPASVQTDTLEERQAARLEAKKDILAKRVADGTMTQAEADQILAAILANQETCDGTGSARIGQKFGAGFGLGNGQGQGRGGRMGMGRGQGACGGVCQAQ